VLLPLVDAHATSFPDPPDIWVRKDVTLWLICVEEAGVMRFAGLRFSCIDGLRFACGAATALHCGEVRIVRGTDGGRAGEDSAIVPPGRRKDAAWRTWRAKGYCSRLLLKTWIHW